METGVYIFLGMFFLGLMILTVASIICYIRLPKTIMDGPGMERVIKEEADKPAPLTADNDDWNSGFGDDKPVKKHPRIVRGFHDRLLKSIFILGILDVFSVSLVVLLATGIIGTKYRKNEELNDGYYGWFKETDYSIIGDGVIYDEGGIKITMSGIYNIPSLDPGEESWSSGVVKVGFIVENYSGKNADIRVSCNSINGVASSTSYFYMMGNFRKNTTTQIYEPIYKYFPGDEIGQMVIDDVLVFSMKYELLAEAASPVFINTTAEMPVPEFDLSDYHQIFENDVFVIYACNYTDQLHEGYTLYMENRSDMNYTVDIEGMAIDRKGVTAEGIYDALIPAGNIMSTAQIYSYDSIYGAASPYNREVMLSLSFKCLDDEKENFSTGYMPLN